MVNQEPSPYGQYPGQNTTIIVPNFGSESTRMTCPSCRCVIQTSTNKKLSSTGWWSVLCLCCFCCCIGGLIPCCMDSCNNVKHSCPKCGSYLGELRN